jgi:hypothetical protein
VWRRFDMKPIIRGSLVVMLLLATAALQWGGLGCSGNDRKTMGEAFFTYSETELVNFKLSGEAQCGSCAGEDIAGLYIELVAEVSPTTNLSVGTFEGLGNFYFPNLRAVAESSVIAYGTLFFEDKPESQALRAQASFQVPDDEDETVAITLQFGQ